MTKIALVGLIGLYVSTVLAEKNFSSSCWNGQFDEQSGVLKSFRPNSESAFDFSPSDYYSSRNGPGNYHTGDLTLRYRRQGQDAWQELDTAAQRSVSPNSTTRPASLLVSNFDNVFPDAARYLNITREWTTAGNGDLMLLATLTNRGPDPIEIGAFGFPIEFNNIFTNRTQEEIASKCSLVDPYIGLDAGYLQVTRLAGVGPHLVITPVGSTSKFEAWRFLTEAAGATAYQSKTFEGLYAWQMHSLAYAQREWTSATPWNVATSRVLAVGEAVTFGLRFAIAPEVHEIEDTVAAVGRPVAVGVPGYVLPRDQIGQLFLRSTANVTSIVVDPPKALTFVATTAKNPALFAYVVRSTGFGRARATITYANGFVQTVHYFVTDSATATATRLSKFMFDRQFFADTTDPFSRAPSIITYDNAVQAQVLQEARSWIAGISGEGGTSYVAAAMKTSFRALVDEVQKLENMATQTIAGRLQDTKTNGSLVPFGVKRSLFFYDPTLLPNYPYNPNINFRVPTSFSKAAAYRIDRAYDYVHASAIYFALYFAQRGFPGVLKIQDPIFYLRMAYQTALASQALGADGKPLVRFASFGLIGETVWRRILAALKAENLTKEFAALEAAMKNRQLVWAAQALPFGSANTFDTVAQEGVYIWSRYFNDTVTLTKALTSIRGFMPTIAHWGYNGNARNFFGFLSGGKLARIERTIGHYGSSLNAIPLLDAFRYNPNATSIPALYDLRVGFGGLTAPLANVDPTGFASTAFHAFPETLAFDSYSGDIGPAFGGLINGAATYLVEHPDFGFLSFGGNLRRLGNVLTIQPRDVIRRRVYVAPLGLFFEIDAGKITHFTYDVNTRQLIATFAALRESPATEATLVFEDTLGTGVNLASGSGLVPRLGGFAVSLPGTVTFGIGCICFK